MKRSTSLPVKIPNGETVPVKNVGTMQLPNGLKIDGVLNIPNFECNLLSVSKLTREFNCALTFFPGFCTMQDLHSRKLIGMGKQAGGLYIMESMREEGKAMSVKVDSTVWHQRLGHASFTKLQKLNFLSNLSRDDCSDCDSCLRAKHTRLPFPISSIITKSCFELLHCDLWGPYKTSSFSGAHYFLSIVDDYSRGVWVYLMRQKSEVAHFLTMFCNMVQTQFEK